MRGQFLEHIKSWHIDAILGWQSHHWSIGVFVPVCLCAWGSKMLWFYNVLGSHAWPISRTYQIVAHWCNSWVTVASLVDRRISMITARSCTSRQMGPIQRKPFVDIHFFCVLSWVMWRPDHTDVSQLQGQRLDTRKRMTREMENESICEGRVSLSCECRLCIRTARRQCSRISSVANF